MTFRVRPGSTRTRTWDDRDRRTLLMNVGFGLTVVAALLLLAIAFGATWYGEHLASAATVNGQSISKDAFQRQLAVDSFRVDYQRRRIRTLLSAGHIRSSDAQARLAALDQYAAQANTIALEQLVDGIVMDQLATRQGVAVADADVDARLTEEATIPERRHAWVIAVEPTLAANESTPTDAEKAAAKAKATQALADLRAGKDWETVARNVSTDTTRDQAGDLGFVDENNSLDEAFSTALLAAAKDTPTDVVDGADGVYRIGRVTEVVPATVDATLQQQVQDAGISLADFRQALRLDVVHDKLSDAILAPLLAAAPQREVQEIYMQASSSETGPGAIRVRHILFSPNGDPDKASSVDANDPAWAAAKVKADATYEKLKADPGQFDAIARAQSDETAAATSGGKLPYFSTDDAIDEAFAAVIFKSGLQPGQLLEPVKSAFGWHVIQVMHYPTDVDWAKGLKAEAEAGKDFGTLARDNSDKADAARGGDLGWVARGQLDKQLEDAIFATKVGGISDPITVDGDGVYLFKVSREETRKPDATQKAAFESTAFSKWYSEQKAQFTITRDASITSTATS